MGVVVVVKEGWGGGSHDSVLEVFQTVFNFLSKIKVPEGGESEVPLRRQEERLFVTSQFVRTKVKKKNTAFYGREAALTGEHSSFLP